MTAAIRKTLGSLAALLLALGPTAWLPRAGASEITDFRILGAAGGGSDILVAGQPYELEYHNDAAPGTSARYAIGYSYDGGATWNDLTVSTGGSLSPFILPIHPGAASVLLRVDGAFGEPDGTASFSARTIGPYPVSQPTGITDLIAAPNSDGTITLSWNDSSDTESGYDIVRYSLNDATAQTFRVKRKPDDCHCPVTFTDKKTDLTQPTVYVYAVASDLSPPYTAMTGAVSVNVTTTVPGTSVAPLGLDADNPVFRVAGLHVSPDILASGYKATSGIRLDKEALLLVPGENATLTAAVTPNEATNKRVSWTSDNPEVAAVDETGAVTAMKPGTATIAAQTEEGGFTAVSVVTVIAGASDERPDGAAPVFADIAGHRAEREIVAAYERGIVNGYGDGTFRPDESVTRAEFAVMLMNALAPPRGNDATAPQPVPDAPFKDAAVVPRFAASAVAEAANLGIANGYADRTFRPSAYLNRAEMIAMVVRASGLPTADSRQTGYADDASIPAWARGAIGAAEAAHIASPAGELPDGLFRPTELVTRADAASAIVRMIEELRK